MKNLILIFIALFGMNVFAESGYSQIEKLYNQGQGLNLKTLKMIDQGIYVGRCFEEGSNYPYGSFVTFKNVSHDSGPIAVDPELYLSTGSSQQTDYYDTVEVQDLVSRLKLNKAEKLEDKITYEVVIPGWNFEFRSNGDYIIQQNWVNGTEDSYCYYYSFRAK